MHRKIFTLFSKSVVAKLALVVLLVVGGGNLAWAQKSLPYSYGFENNNLTVEGWEMVNCTVGTYSFSSTGITTTNAISDTYSFRFYPNSTPPQYLISPLLNNTSSKINISFYHKTNSGNALFNVGYSTSDKNSFIWLSNDETSTSNKAQFDKYFSSEEEPIKYIAIAYKTNSTSISMYLDDIVIDIYNPYKTPNTFSASNITATTANLNWTIADGYSPTSFQVKYKKGTVFTPTDDASDGAELVDGIVSNSYTLTSLDPESIYYVYIRACYDGGNSEWVQLTGTTFTTLELYPKPTNFTCTGFAAETATFSWNNGTGTTPTSWQIKYSETQGFNPDNEGTLEDNITNNPCTLSGLTENTTYYARIRAFYGDNHYSDWNIGEVTFMPTSDITVNDGSSLTSQNVPIRRASVNTDTKSQFIIKSNNLTNIQNRQIRRLVFYSSTTSADFGDATFDVYVKETSKTSIPSATLDNVMGTNVLSNATLSVNGNKMVVDFNVPFNYTNGNLMISFKLHSQGSGSAIYWHGSYISNGSYYEYNNGNNSRDNFSPKTTIVSRPVTTAPVKIGSTGYTTFASSWKLNLDALPEGLKAFYVAPDGVDASVVHLTEATGIVAANTGLILKGEANTTYAIPTTDESPTYTFGGNNLMVGVCPLETSLGTDAKKYVLVNNNGTPEFQSLADVGATIPAGKAYLEVPGAARSLRIVFDGEATGIEDAKRAATENSSYYNLQGQRVVAPQKGLYIVNGKKVVVNK